MLKTYFRTHPFEMKFSTFILNLQKDPWFTIEEFNRRTDSTFFYLSGSYKNFNPFRFAPTQIKLVVAEEVLIHMDSLHTHDTVVNLQLIAFTDTSSVNKSAAAKEFKRFHNNQAQHFYNTNYKNYDRSSVTIAEIENYFVYPFSIAPVTVAWGLVAETRQYVFTITIRFKVKQNLANYIAAPGESFD